MTQEESYHGYNIGDTVYVKPNDVEIQKNTSLKILYKR